MIKIRQQKAILWIPADELRPTKPEQGWWEGLLTFNSGRAVPGCFDGSRFFAKLQDGRNYHVYPTAWAEMPEGYKEEV